MRRGLCVVLWFVAACAAATTDATHPDDASASEHHDAMVSHDASVHADAALPKDAAIGFDAPVVPSDAPGSGGELCADNTGCLDPGTCCYFFVCTAGVGAGSNLCFPSS
jgi:hypothetical protein